MWYAIVGPGLKTVSKDWKRIEELSKIFPYCKYRKFPTEEACWRFIAENARSYSDLSLYKYGNTFERPFIRFKYFMKDNKAYFTFNKEHFGTIRLITDEDCLVEYQQKCVTVLYTNGEEYNPDLILHHLQVIQLGVEMLGDFVDVDIVVPNYSIYYALTIYSGDNDDIKFIIDLLKSRMGQYSITLNNKKVILDE